MAGQQDRYSKREVKNSRLLDSRSPQTRSGRPVALVWEGSGVEIGGMARKKAQHLNYLCQTNLDRVCGEEQQEREKRDE